MAVFVHPTSIDLAENQPAPWLAVPLDANSVATLQAKYPGRCAKLTEAAGHLIYIPQIVAVPQQYRKWVTDHVEEMSSGEKATVDAAAAAAEAAAQIVGYDAAVPPGVWKSTVVKPSTTTRTATTVLADDPHLKFPVVAGGKYIFEFRIFFDTTAAGDFKIGMNGPASPAGVRFFRFAVAPGATALSAIGVSVVYNGGVAITGTGTTGGYAYAHGIIENGPNAGDVALQWAQNTSDGGNTRVLQGSIMRFARIG